MIKTFLVAVSTAFSSLAFPITFQSIDQGAIDLPESAQHLQISSDLQKDFRFVGLGIERSSDAVPVIVTVTQSNVPISPTGGNGHGSFDGMGLAPSGHSLSVNLQVTVPDSASTGPMLLGSLAFGLLLKRKRFFAPIL
jgi:hypothetical protein